MQLHLKSFTDGEYTIDIEQELNFIIGSNGSGKTFCLDAIHKYLQDIGETVIHIDCLRHPTTQFAEWDIKHLNKAVKSISSEMEKSQCAARSMFESIVTKLYIGAPDDTYSKLNAVMAMGSGYSRLITTFAVLHDFKPNYVLLDMPESSLSISISRHYVEWVRNVVPSATVIIATHSPEILGSYFSSPDCGIFETEGGELYSKRDI